MSEPAHHIERLKWILEFRDFGEESTAALTAAIAALEREEHRAPREVYGDEEATITKAAKEERELPPLTLTKEEAVELLRKFEQGELSPNTPPWDQQAVPPDKPAAILESSPDLMRRLFDAIAQQGGNITPENWPAWACIVDRLVELQPVLYSLLAEIEYCRSDAMQLHIKELNEGWDVSLAEIEKLQEERDNAVLAEREACAEVALGNQISETSLSAEWGRQCAMAIRRRTKIVKDKQRVHQSIEGYEGQPALDLEPVRRLIWELERDTKTCISLDNRTAIMVQARQALPALCSLLAEAEYLHSDSMQLHLKELNEDLAEAQGETLARTSEREYWRQRTLEAERKLQAMTESRNR